jgi:DNA-binding transcriptional LysR family regulator
VSGLSGLSGTTLPTVNLNTLDVNLLRLFDAIMEERSVVRAGRRLALNPSAVSHALNRLRHILKDELFVRTSDGMQPTARAVELSRPLRQALLQIAAALGPPDFDPATAHRRFFLAANDYVTAVLLPPLINHFSTPAPRIDLVVRPSTRLDLTEQIDMGCIDVALGVFSSIPPRFRSRPILRQDDVLVMREGHAASRHSLSPPCCIGWRPGLTDPSLCGGSCDPDILRPSKIQHPVQDIGGDGHFSRLAPLRL